MRFSHGLYVCVCVCVCVCVYVEVSFLWWVTYFTAYLRYRWNIALSLAKYEFQEYFSKIWKSYWNNSQKLIGLIQCLFQLSPPLMSYQVESFASHTRNFRVTYCRPKTNDHFEGIMQFTAYPYQYVR